MNRNDIFEDLFVLEMANNHWGSLDRGLLIIDEFSRVARYNNVKTAIKLQFRDVDNFIHNDFKNRNDIRYIKKTLATKMSVENYGILVESIRKNNCITMSTPFDEESVNTCVELGIQIIKIASSDLNDLPLIDKIIKTKKPVIVSTGGSNLNDLDNLVALFDSKNIPLAINHCIAMYPCEKDNLELNQINFLKKRFPKHVIGFSTHERNDNIEYALLMAYAKGARTFERHVDVDYNNVAVSPYCSLPSDIDRWYKGFNMAKKMNGGNEENKKTSSEIETKYLDALVRGFYVKNDLPKNHIIKEEDVYLAIPLQRGQLSCREIIIGETLKQAIKKDEPITLNKLNNHYSEYLRSVIYNRGL